MYGRLPGGHLLSCRRTADHHGKPGFDTARIQCRHPADPHRRHHACDDQDFDWDETLAGGWNDIRRAAKRIGITPTASYVSVLQTNVTGGKDQVWDYAGQFSFAASADLRELLKIPGLSAYVGASWGTGSNLAGSLDSTAPHFGALRTLVLPGRNVLAAKLVAAEADDDRRPACGRQYICRASCFRKLCELRNQSKPVLAGSK